jgi:hypothetical protein
MNKMENFTLLPSITWNMGNVVRFIMPMVLGYLTSQSCWRKVSGKRAGATVAFRPPAYVFGIVWPLLYIMIGLSWVIAAKTRKQNTHIEVCYISISVLLASWIFLYGCKNKKVWGVYSIALSIGAVIMTMNVVDVESRILLVPLITWLLLALLLNVFEVSKT